MATKQSGGKNRKIGRHSRPSTATTRVPRGLRPNGSLSHDTITFKGKRTRVYAL